LSSDKYEAENSADLTHPALMLAEGKADVSFLMHLLEERGVTAIHFGFPTDATGGFGVTGFGRYLSGLPARAGFKKLKAVIVLYDNDNDPAAKFAEVSALVDPNDPYSVPNAPLVLANADAEKVRLLFLPMPGVGVNGALETLLLQSAAANSAESVACVDTLVTCARIEGWPPSPLAKMRLRCLISVRCQGNSDVTLTHIWGKAGNPVDLTNACFDRIVQTVRDVVAVV